MTIERMVNGQRMRFELKPDEIRQASGEYDTQCRAMDILLKIKEQIAKSFEELPWFTYKEDVAEKMVFEEENKLEEAAEDLVDRVERTLSKNDTYFDCIWDAISYVIESDLCGESYEAEEIDVEYRDGHVIIKAEDKPVADLSPEETKILDFDFWADCDNRETVLNKLSDLHYATCNAF